MINPRYIGDPFASFQGSTPAVVIGLSWLRSLEHEGRNDWRLCLHLQYPDGREDYAVLTEALERGFLPPPTPN